MADGVIPFYRRLYEAVNDHSLDSIISWGKSNNSFIIWDPRELDSKLISVPRPSRRLACSSLKKFFYDVKYYGFKRVKGSPHIEFGNEYFVRGKPELLLKMQRKSFDKNRRKNQAAAENQAIQDAKEFGVSDTIYVFVDVCSIAVYISLPKILLLTGIKVRWVSGGIIKDRVASDDDKRTVRERLCSSCRLRSRKE
ncbi:PREDICTED: heat stress transcription factor A-6b-like [Camelina sativa]|uniref:Heat stress transcription factor A-6b-like n=1 Tax=Camelina sativa TaxID=90675 RepID=A0ABM0V5I1_CAMSA|nr:PREDICTED: heat stress transcription factor A-6b-like [Camelina sativa]